MINSIIIFKRDAFMSAIYDKTQHYAIIRKTCYSANIIYLFVRLFYLILFLISQTYILAIIDGVSIVAYLLCFLMLKKQKYYLYALLCGNEFFAFVSVTTIMLGFGSGFHLYLIGLCVVSFFTTYFSKDRNTKGSILWVGLSLAIYLTLYLVTKFNAPYYAIENWLEITLFITHALAVFAFVASYMVVFLKYAVSLENKIMNESRTDELTQISNRYGLYDYFDQVEDKASLTLAIFDIDDFKNINDTYGHVAGDFVLKRVAEIATESMSDSFVCRFGGEEFVVILRDDARASSFDKLEALRKSIEKESFEFNGAKIMITITIGGAKYSEGFTIENWFEKADEKMYFGKNSGKNKTVL